MGSADASRRIGSGLISRTDGTGAAAITATRRRQPAAADEVGAAACGKISATPEFFMGLDSEETRVPRIPVS